MVDNLRGSRFSFTKTRVLTMLNEDFVLDLVCCRKICRNVFYENEQGLVIIKNYIGSGEIIGVNEAFIKITGYPESELVGDSYQKLLSPSVRLELSSFVFEQLKISNTSVPFEKRIITKYGRSKWIKTVVTKLCEDYVVSKEIDITEQKRVESDLCLISGIIKPKLPDAIRGRQREVARLAALDLSTKEIADRMNLSPLTVENYRTSLRRALGLDRGERLGDVLSTYRF